MDKRLEELLREQSDIENLLEAFGEEASGEEKADRQRVLELAADFGDAQLLSALFDHAKGFALMSQEIFDFCAESGTGIAGQIQVQADAIQFAEHSLDAGWAFGGGTRWTSGAEQRASSLASELESIASSLSKKKLLRTTHETYVEPWARHLDDREPQSQLLRDIATESRTHRFFTEGDYSEINAFRVELSDAQGRLAHAPIGAAVASAFSELETKCHSLLREMRPVRPGESHAQIRAARDNFASTTSQVLRLVDEVTEGRRVEAGLADFLRTDFWHQRWRVYEIWVLVWTLRSLQACGAKTQLSNVEQGVWMLKYGRALEPVAICEIGGKLLEVYYQLYRKRAQANQKSASKKSADMPDIAVLRKGGRPLCVIDPKHGRSYGRSAVQKVLNTYSTIFKADFTAIVNCLAMEDYQYEETYVGTRLGVVASGVAPGASAAARLREVFPELLASAGYDMTSYSREVTAVSTKRHLSKGACLLYWATKAREVDEPEGLWMMADEEGPLPLGNLHESIGSTVDGLDASGDGKACVIVGPKEIVSIREGGTVRKLNKPAGFKAGAFNTNGGLYAGHTGREIVVLDHGGEKIRKSWASYVLDLCWLDSDNLLVLGYDSRNLTLHRWRLSGEPDLLLEKEGSSVGSRLVRLGEGKGALAISDKIRTVVTAEGKLEAVEQRSDLDQTLGASPSGRYYIVSGPPSRRAAEGVTLLTVVDNSSAEKNLPYVRFFGRVEGQMLWHPDESSCALMSWRTDERVVKRLLRFRPGDRYAAPVSLPEQSPSHFAWVTRSLVRSWIV